MLRSRASAAFEMVIFLLTKNNNNKNKQTKQNEIDVKNECNTSYYNIIHSYGVVWVAQALTVFYAHFERRVCYFLQQNVKKNKKGFRGGSFVLHSI